MISTIRGKLVKKSDTSVLIDVNGVGYDVFVPMTVLNELRATAEGAEVSLVTFHYYSTDPSRNIPVLVGFINEIEKEFFERFITVSGVGPKAAIKAMNKPMSEIARAIDAGDEAFLRSLPGIGGQRAKEIIAKLQNKVGKFGLMQDDARAAGPASKRDIENEAMQVLIKLQYKKHEAEAMIKKALEGKQDVSSGEELLNEVYRQKKNSV